MKKSHRMSGKASEERRESQTLAAGLYAVATPIGNLADMTLRARDVLAAADVIACEDTRVSGKLLRHYGIHTPTISYHDHSDVKRTGYLIERLAQGERVALISDAGTPLLSDPGFPLVKAARDAGIAVYTIPGPSSIIAALSIAGLPAERFFFAGFLPAKDGARGTALEELAQIPATLVFFESPRRVAESLRAMCNLLGNAREAAVARELTKLHEEVRRGSLKELAEYYADKDVKGEIVLLVAPPSEKAAVSDDDIEAMLKKAMRTLSLKDAVEAVARASGCPRKQVYQQALSMKESR